MLMGHPESGAAGPPSDRGEASSPFFGGRRPSVSNFLARRRGPQVRPEVGELLLDLLGRSARESDLVAEPGDELPARDPEAVTVLRTPVEVAPEDLVVG